MVATKVLAYFDLSSAVLFNSSSLISFTKDGVEVLYKKQQYMISVEHFSKLNPSGKEALKESLSEIIDHALAYGVFSASPNDQVATGQGNVVDLKELLKNVLEKANLSNSMDNYTALKELLEDNDQNVFFLIGHLADELRGQVKMLRLKKEIEQAANAPIIRLSVSSAKGKRTRTKGMFTYLIDELAEAKEYLRP